MVVEQSSPTQGVGGLVLAAHFPSLSMELSGMQRRHLLSALSTTQLASVMASQVPSDFFLKPSLQTSQAGSVKVLPTLQLAPASLTLVILVHLDPSALKILSALHLVHLVADS